MRWFMRSNRPQGKPAPEHRADHLFNRHALCKTDTTANRRLTDLRSNAFSDQKLLKTAKTMIRRSILTLCVALLSVLFSGQIAMAQDAATIAKRLQEKYDEVESLRATFTQTMKSDFLDSSESSSGLFALSGKRFRVETKEQTFVTDGAITWLFNSASNELLVNDYVEEDMFPVRQLIFEYEERYNVDGVRSETYKGQKTQVLSLSAKNDEDLYRSVTLFVRDKDTIVTRLEILDANETIMIFELTDIEVNPTLDAGLFTFTAPDGTDVIDLRS